MARPPTSDLIDDSEPERVDLRDEAGTRSRMPLNLGIIEISDSDSEDECRGLDLLPQLKVRPSPRTANNEEASNEDGDTPPRTLQLSKFAFPSAINPPKAFLSNIPSGTSNFRDTPPTMEPEKKKALPKKATKVFSSQFTEQDYAKIQNCICCAARWTSRKTAVQKTQHMQTCCKKAAYTQETIDILLRKAIHEISVAGVAPSPDRAATPTLFNNFNPPKPKKKARPQLPKSTVAKVTDTRSEILNRAQLFLHSPEIQGQELQPPPTQQFGRSKLGAMGGIKTTIFDVDAISDDDRPISLVRQKEGRVVRFNPSTNSINTGHDVLVPALSAVPPQNMPSGSVQVVVQSSRSRRLRKAPKPVFDAAWEEKLKRKIIEDPELYLRVLRLEPINLDAIIVLVSNDAKPSARLKRRLVEVLDQEGITFYASEPRRGKTAGGR